MKRFNQRITGRKPYLRMVPLDYLAAVIACWGNARVVTMQARILRHGMQNFSRLRNCAEFHVFSFL